jgi:hypothetical protein
LERWNDWLKPLKINELGVPGGVERLERLERRRFAAAVSITPKICRASAPNPNRPRHCAAAVPSTLGRAADRSPTRRRPQSVALPHQLADTLQHSSRGETHKSIAKETSASRVSCSRRKTIPSAGEESADVAAT